MAETIIQNDARWQTVEEADVMHYVCPCTDDTISFCGLDLDGASWDESDTDIPCPLCELVNAAPTCPWGGCW